MNKRIALLLAGFAFATPAAFGQDKPTSNLSAAGVNITSAAVQAGAKWLLNSYTSFTTYKNIDHTLIDRPLSQAEIDEILKYAEDSSKTDFSIGNTGRNIFVEYDASQAARMAGSRNAKTLTDAYAETAANNAAVTPRVILAPPVESPVSIDALAEKLAPGTYTTKELSVLNPADLKMNLTQLAEDGVSVRQVFARGVLARGGSKILGTLQVLLFAGAVSNAVHAAYYAAHGVLGGVDTWQADRCTQVKSMVAGAEPQMVCEAPGALSFWLNTSSAVYFRFIPEIKNTP